MTEELITEARRLPEDFRIAQLSETQYLEDDALANLDAAGYMAVHTALRLADAIEAVTAERDRLKAAIEEALTGEFLMTVTPRRILSVALNEGKNDDR